MEEELVIMATSPATKASVELASLSRAPASYMAFHSVRKVASAPLSTHTSSVAVPSAPLLWSTT